MNKASKFREWRADAVLVPKFINRYSCEYCNGRILDEEVAQDLSIKHGQTFCHDCAGELSDACSVCGDRALKHSLKDRLFALVCGECDRE